MTAISVMEKIPREIYYHWHLTSHKIFFGILKMTLNKSYLHNVFIVGLTAWISMTLSLGPSLSSIAPGRSSYWSANTGMFICRGP